MIQNLKSEYLEATYSKQQLKKKGRKRSPTRLPFENFFKLKKKEIISDYTPLCTTDLFSGLILHNENRVYQ